MRVLTFVSLAIVACAPARPAVSSSPKPVEPQASSPVDRAKLPTAENALPLPGTDAPTIVVAAGDVYCDGEKVDDVRTVVQLKRLDGLFQALKRRDRSGNGNALLAVDASTPNVVVKSVFQTAAFAGYPNGQLAVRKSGALARLPLDAIVPMPGGRAEADVLLVEVRPSSYALAWRRASGQLLPRVEASSLADLQQQVRHAWTTNGLHREAPDKAFDQAVVFATKEVSYAELVSVLDALASVARPLADERVPALNVSLAMPERAGAGDPRTIGRLPPEVIQRVVRAAGDRYRACYEQGLRRDKSLAGSVRVRFVIEARGAIAEVRDAGESTLPDAEAVTCILHEFEKLSFPPPEGGTVTVVYPLVFHP